MRLEPVYLLAPEPEPPKVTRRAAVMGCVAVALGSFAGGWMVGRTLTPASDQPAAVPPQHDADARWLRDLSARDSTALATAFPQLVAVLERRPELAELIWPELTRLAHGLLAGELREDPEAARQPILLSQACEAPNGATLVALADGAWRAEAEQFERALLFFADEQRAEARETWRKFDGREDVTREFFELENGKWIKRT